MGQALAEFWELHTKLPNEAMVMAAQDVPRREVLRTRKREADIAEMDEAEADACHRLRSTPAPRRNYEGAA